jgi:hypothetical protein
MRSTLALSLACLALACARGEGDADAKRRLDASAAPGEAAFAFDPARPADALGLDADAVARRLGSFEWTAAVEWSVTRPGDDAARVRAVERHRLRQLATGEFESEAELDPGLGPGSETGRGVIFANGMTYARGRYAPVRERPTDRGRDARRYRDESFRMAASVAALHGGRLALTPAGEAKVLGRPALRYRIALAKDAQGAAPAAAPVSRSAQDDDTKLRFAFLDGKVPVSADGELLLDAKTGAPLRVRLASVFDVQGAPGVRAAVELHAQVKALGSDVAAVTPPKDALLDVRKPPGVADALEAAGLRKRGEETPARAEPEDEAE